MAKTFGQLDARQERNSRYQSWLNCSQVLPGHVTLPPPSRVDIPSTIKLLRETIPTVSDPVMVDVGTDTDAIPVLRAQLTPQENAMVRFGSRQHVGLQQ
jgi:hypothetical protein